MKSIWLSFKQSLPMVLIAILCWPGCAVVRNEPSQLSRPVLGNTKAGASSDSTGCNSDKGIVISPEGKSQGYAPSTQIFCENDSDKVAIPANAENVPPVT